MESIYGDSPFASKYSNSLSVDKTMCQLFIHYFHHTFDYFSWLLPILFSISLFCWFAFDFRQDKKCLDFYAPFMRMDFHFLTIPKCPISWLTKFADNYYESKKKNSIFHGIAKMNSDWLSFDLRSTCICTNLQLWIIGFLEKQSKCSWFDFNYRFWKWNRLKHWDVLDFLGCPMVVYIFPKKEKFQTIEAKCTSFDNSLIHLSKIVFTMSKVQSDRIE